MKQTVLVVVLVFLTPLAVLGASPQSQVYSFGGSGLGGGGYLGVHLRDVGPDDVADLGLDRERGVYIEEVAEDSPAQEAGIRSGDVVIAFAGIDVLSVRQFQRLVSDTPSGRRVEVVLVRDGTTQTLNVEIGGSKEQFSPRTFRLDMPEFSYDFDKLRRLEGPDFQFGENSPIVVYSGHPRLGIRGQALTQQMAEFLGVAGGEGVLIMEVIEDTPAGQAGLKAGDVIVKVGDSSVETVPQLTSKLRAGAQSLTIVRNKQTQQVEVELESPGARKKSKGGIRM